MIKILNETDYYTYPQKIIYEFEIYNKRFYMEWLSKMRKMKFDNDTLFEKITIELKNK